MSLKQKLFAVQQAVQKVEKGGTNTYSKYEYARLGDVLEALRPLLKQEALVIYQSHSVEQSMFQEYEDGTKYSVASVVCYTVVVDTESNEELKIQTPGFAIDKNGDKAVYKAITGSRKYGLTSMFGLDWDTAEPEADDEPRATTQRTNRKKVF